MKLRDVLEIREVVSGESVCGLSRGVVWPQDVLEIEGIGYRVCGLIKRKSVTAFFATVKDIFSVPQGLLEKMVEDQCQE